MYYQSPCFSCPYNYCEIDEYGDPIKDECNRPEGGECWIEEWIKEYESEAGRARNAPL